MNELLTYLLEQFESPAALNAYLQATVWPAFKRRAEHAEAAKLANAPRRHILTPAEIAERERIKTQAMAERKAARAAAKAEKLATIDPPNQRFCDVDDKPLSTGQVIQRSKRHQLVKEIKTGRLMYFVPDGIARGTGNWLEYKDNENKS